MKLETFFLYLKEVLPKYSSVRKRCAILYFNIIILYACTTTYMYKQTHKYIDNNYYIVK